jgi:hypothetical protein
MKYSHGKSEELEKVVGIGIFYSNIMIYMCIICYSDVNRRMSSFLIQIKGSFARICLQKQRE